MDGRSSHSLSAQRWILVHDRLGDFGDFLENGGYTKYQIPIMESDNSRRQVEYFQASFPISKQGSKNGSCVSSKI